jgi:hypothetical protein
MTAVSVPTPTLSDSQPLRHKNGYHLQADGEAIDTVRAHSEPQELTLFGEFYVLILDLIFIYPTGANFCPFVQR